MDISALIHTWGYAAAALGGFLQSQTIVLAAGAAAANDWLWLPGVVLATTTLAFLDGELLFLVGRRWGRRLVARYPRLQPGTARVAALLERHDVLAILGVRFLYGLRTIGPIAIGMSAVPRRRFLTLNLAGALLWSAVVAAVGYVLGLGLEQALPLLAHLNATRIGWLAAGLAGVVLAAAFFLVRHWRRSQPAPTAPPHRRDAP